MNKGQYIIILPMHQFMIMNGTQFPMQKLKVTKGSIPKSILGSYIKNGPGLMTIGDQVLPHWFMGDSGLLKVQLHDGNAYAKYKMVQTAAYKRDSEQKNFNRPNVIIAGLKKMIGFKSNNDEVHNSASTSILRLPNSKDFLALYQGGLAYRMQQKPLKQVGFDDFGFVQGGFSAHPKVDPQNGDIYNIGFNLQAFYLYRMTKDLKLIAKTSVKYRVTQSIHDCCLAGDFLIVFECPLKLNYWKLLQGHFGPKCYSIDYSYGKTIVHILKKQNLQYVKRVELSSPEAFFIYHFTNGYTQNNKLYVQYVKYAGQNAQKLLDLVDYMPAYALKQRDNKKINFFSQLQTLQIDLQDFSYKFSQKDFDCEFPICQDSQVGKKWRYSYFITKNKGAQFLDFNRIVRYDRINDKTLEKHFQNCCIVEPALIRTKEGLFVLVLKSSPQGCSIQILQGDKFETVAEIQLPQHIPFGFHGKWLDMQNKDLLQTSNL